MESIDLLRLEMETLWERDAYGRVRNHPLVALAVAEDGLAVRLGPSLHPDLRKALEEKSIDGLSPETILDEYRGLLGAYGTVELRGGPSYVFPDALEEVGPLDIEILTSEESVAFGLAAGRPGAWWEPEEWEDLLAGRLGPWAIGLAGGTVAAICHTPVGSTVAAEAGVWTHPEWRGRGYAAAVTSAWAKVARKDFETLFYSTSFDNAASQAVARKLRTRPIGRIWQLQAVTALRRC